MKKVFFLLLLVLLTVQQGAGEQQQKQYTYDSGLQKAYPGFTLTITVKFTNGTVTPIDCYNLTITEYVDAKLVSTDYNSTVLEISGQVNHFRILEQSPFYLKVSYTNKLTLSSFEASSPAPFSNVKTISQSGESTSVSINTFSILVSVLFLSILIKRKK